MLECLVDKGADVHKVQVGDYRVLYVIEEFVREIEILRVTHRSKAVNLWGSLRLDSSTWALSNSPNLA